MRRARRQTASLPVAVLLLAGCWPAFDQGPAQVEGADAARVTRVVQQGTLRISIFWPAGPGRDLAGYHAQLIPDSTSRVAVAVTRSDGEVVGTGSVMRLAGQASSTLDIMVPYANNLSVAAEAFPTGNGPAGNAGPIARGTAAGVNVNANLVTADLTLGSLYVPSIDALGINAGPTGQAVTITGANLAPDWAAAPAVAFGGTPAAQVIKASPTSVTAIVAPGTTVGQVTAVTDGVDSTGTATFWVVAGIALSIADHTLFGQSLTGNSPYVGYGGQLQTAATTTFALAAGKTLADYPAPPVVSFGTTVPGGTHTADAGAQGVGATTTARNATFGAPGAHQTGKVRAMLGDAAGERDVEAIGIDAVAISPPANTLNVVKPTAQSGLADMPGAVTLQEYTATVSHSIPTGFPAAPGIEWSTSGLGGKLIFSGAQTDGSQAGKALSRINVTTDETAPAGSDGKVTATAKVGSSVTGSKAEASVTTTTTGQVDAVVQ